MGNLQDLRNKLKPTLASSMEESDRQLNQTMGRKTDDNNRLKIEDGLNIFRFFPPHEPVDEFGRPNPFAEPLSITFIPGEVKERDKEGKEVLENGKPKIKIGRRPVFDARVHGKRDANGKLISKDLIAEFIRLATEKSRDWSKEDREKFLAPVYGLYSKDPNKRVEGVNYTQSWAIYATKIVGETSVFGKLEIKKSVKNRLNKLAAIEAAEQPLGTDPFTDLDAGRAVRIVYNPDAEKADDYYTTELDNSTTQVTLEGGRKANVIKEYLISDDDLGKFAEEKPLAEMYRNCFKRSDLEKQIFGLTYIDSQYEMGVVDSPEFQKILEELIEMYPEEEGDDDNENEAQSPMAKEEVSGASVKTDLPFDEDQDMFSMMTRDELKEFSKDNSTGIVVLPASQMPDETLRNELRRWLIQKDVKAEDETKGSIEVAGEIKPQIQESKPLTAKERLEALKNKGKE